MSAAVIVTPTSPSTARNVVAMPSLESTSVMSRSNPTTGTGATPSVRGSGAEAGADVMGATLRGAFRG